MTTPPIRYRFGSYVLSPARRMLLRDGREVPLIPRYFDLLVLLLEQRQQVVDRTRIFDVVWSDVVVSDGALTQAVRTLRRTLGDDPRRPRFIRTASRHGYQFIFEPVVEEDDAAPLPGVAGAAAGAASDPGPAGERSALVNRLLESTDEMVCRDAAEALHALGTREALAALQGRGGEAAARAWLRETRWEVPGAGEVSLLTASSPLRVVLHLVGLRLRRAARQAGRRWGGASLGGALAGVTAGLLEGALFLALETVRPLRQLVIFATLGAVIGGVGAAGVGAGLSAAEALSRSRRRLALVVCGALGGGGVGSLANLCGRWTLEGMFGRSLEGVGGGLEGLILGGAAGLGYALATPALAGGGMASPRGQARVRAALLTGLACALGGVALTLAGGTLGGASLDLLGRSVGDTALGLQPLARLLGEITPGTRTCVVQGGFEGFLFGAGLAAGLTRRPPKGIT